MKGKCAAALAPVKPVCRPIPKALNQSAHWLMRGTSIYHESSYRAAFTPKGVSSDAHILMQPFQGIFREAGHPKVARSSQPWPGAKLTLSVVRVWFIVTWFVVAPLPLAGVSFNAVGSVNIGYLAILCSELYGSWRLLQDVDVSAPPHSAVGAGENYDGSVCCGVCLSPLRSVFLAGAKNVRDNDETCDK